MKVWVVLANGERRSDAEVWTQFMGVYGSESVMLEASETWFSGWEERKWEIPFSREKYGHWVGILDVDGGRVRFDFEVEEAEVE